MTIAILATGDELVHGDTLNTNAHQIAHTLSSEGLPLGMHMMCSDKKPDIIACLNFLVQQHDILIIIGGLGPTTDDLTRFALAQFTDDVLIEHEEALVHLQNRLKKNKTQLNAGNLQQCIFPARAEILPNPHGTAVGCYYKWQNKTLILLPGPPRECLPMFHHEVLPRLQLSARSKKHILKWRIFGLAESEIAQTLEDALAEYDCHTGYRLDVPYIEFKVRCKAELLDEIKLLVDGLLAAHIIAPEQQKASDRLFDLIIARNQAITIIDEVTGGILETLLVKPASRHLLYFHHETTKGLSFHLSGLDAYWQQQSCNSTELTITYQKEGASQGREVHVMPYRSPLVIQYAAEWLSFRLFHLINQLH